MDLRTQQRLIFRLRRGNVSDGLEGGNTDWLVDAGSRRKVFSKTRALEENEIVSTVSTHTTSAPTARWTIHRPRAGWYLALRPSSPKSSALSSLGPNGFLSLDPVRAKSSGGTALGFSLRLPEQKSDTTTPPSQPADSPDVQIHINPLDSTLTPSDPDSIQFILRPLPSPPAGGGLWGKLKSGGASVRSLVVGSKSPGWGCYALVREGEEEVMRWEDTCSSFSLSTSSSGVLQLAEDLPRLRGIDESFWAAVAFAFCEFSLDQEAYLAASSD